MPCEEQSQGKWVWAPVTEDNRRRLPWPSLIASAAFTSALLSGSSLVTMCSAALHMATPLSCSTGKWLIRKHSHLLQQPGDL